MQLQPGDLLLCKAANINPKGFFLSRGLDYLDEQLNHPLAGLTSSIEYLPEEIAQIFSGIPTTDEGAPDIFTPEVDTVETPEELPKENVKEVLKEAPVTIPEEVKNPEIEVKKASALEESELETFIPDAKETSPITSDTELTDALRKFVPHIKKRGVPADKHSPSENFYTDDWDIPYGMSFTLMPPYIQI